MIYIHFYLFERSYHIGVSKVLTQSSCNIHHLLIAFIMLFPEKIHVFMSRILLRRNVCPSETTLSVWSSKWGCIFCGIRKDFFLNIACINIRFTICYILLVYFADQVFTWKKIYKFCLYPCKIGVMSYTVFTQRFLLWSVSV